MQIIKKIKKSIYMYMYILVHMIRTSPFLLFIWHFFLIFFLKGGGGGKEEGLFSPQASLESRGSLQRSLL